MKKFYSACFFFIFAFGFSQIPNNYYSTATGTGYTLKTQLSTIISNNSNSNNNANYGDLWILYSQNAFRDNYYENDGSLLDVYSEKPAGPDSYSYTNATQQCGSSTPSVEGGCYNREHVIPQSVFDSNYPMYSDAHFVLPTDNRVNGWRNNFPFGKVVSTTAVSATNATVNNAGTTPVFTTNQSKLGQNLNSSYSAGYSGVVFEPIDEFKGDIARAILYFGTRYQSQIPNWTFSMFDGSSNKVFTDTFLNILLKWHEIDPVSSYEIAKNNAVYTFQGNRNPFIDNPQYVCQIYSQQCATLQNNSFKSFSDVVIYPNPSSDNKINIQTENTIDSLELYSVNGQLIQQIANPVAVNNEITLANIPSGFYFLKLQSANQFITKKVIIK